MLIYITISSLFQLLKINVDKNQENSTNKTPDSPVRFSEPCLIEVRSDLYLYYVVVYGLESPDIYRERKCFKNVALRIFIIISTICSLNAYILGNSILNSLNSIIECHITE